MTALDMGYELLPSVEEARAAAQAILRGYGRSSSRAGASKLAAVPDEAKRRLIRDLTGSRTRASFRCIYCGAHCYGAACASHRDLVQIEAAA